MLNLPRLHGFHMAPTTYVIIGDGVAGHTAAETIREQDEDAEIRVFTTEDDPFYDRIGLRAYVRGGRSRDDLIMNDRDWYADHDIDLHLSTPVDAIDRDSQEISTADGDTYRYDVLLLAVGGHPRTLLIEDDVDNIHHLWTLTDHAEPMKADVENADSAVVIGGGLLGFDIAGSLAETDLDLTYLIREQHWWPSVLTAEGAALVHDAIREHGVDLQLEEEAVAMEQPDDTVHVETNRDTYETDTVGIAVGHIRNTALAEDAGLETRHGIMTDEHLQTADPAIFAAGDVAEYDDVVLERENMAGSWIMAQEQGEHAGENMVRQARGDDLVPFESVDTYTVMHFGLNVASLGDPVHSSDHDVITALDRENTRYRKLVLDDHENGTRVVGAAIIGEMKWMYPLKQLIQNKTDVSDHLTDLQDADTDLKEFL